MSALFNKHFTAEPNSCSLFPNFTGLASTDCLLLTVDGGSEEFTVGDTVTGAGAATGVVYAIQDSTGVWDGVTSTGAATLVLTSTTGTFVDEEAITGVLSGVAVVEGTGTADTIVNNPTSVNGAGIASIVGSGISGIEGNLTVTLSNKFSGLLGVKSCIISTATADDWVIVPVSEAVATTKVIVLQVFKGGALTSPTATEKVFIELVLANSTMKPLSY